MTKITFNYLNLGVKTILVNNHNTIDHKLSFIDFICIAFRLLFFSFVIIIILFLYIYKKKEFEKQYKIDLHFTFYNLHFIQVYF